MLSINTVVKVINNNNNHSYVVGKLYRIATANDASGTYILCDIDTGRTGNYVRDNDIKQMSSREDLVDIHKSAYDKLSSDLKELAKKVIDARNELRMLEKYSSDEEELMSLIEELIESDGDKDKIKDTLIKYRNCKNIKFETFMNEYFA